MNDSICGNLAEMRLVVEGAISIFEKGMPNQDDYSLIGEALYLLREKVSECLTAIQDNR